MAQKQVETDEKDVGSARRRRAVDILNAAAELILRWGYDKTTVEAIAKRAGVAKGTIYLHWKTREDLFEALMRRESVNLEEELKQRISDDPEGSTLHGVYKHSALALINHPILKAFVLRDTEILGKLSRKEQNTAAYAERLEGFKTYLEFLRERGLIRTDLPLRAEVYAVGAIFTGFFLTRPLAPDEFALSDEELANLIGETIQRTLEVQRPISTEELKTVSDTFMPYLERITESDRSALDISESSRVVERDILDEHE